VSPKLKKKSRIKLSSVRFFQTFKIINKNSNNIVWSVGLSNIGYGQCLDGWPKKKLLTHLKK
jgi:hypothetical protein